MTLKEVANVIDDINEWENPRGGSVYYVTAIFTDESVGSVGRKDQDAALEVQGLLRESIGVEQDFTLEPAGQTKTGREKFKIKGFGTPGGAATYTAPGSVQGGGSQAPSGVGRSNRSPEHDVDASIRAAVALKAAVALSAADPVLNRMDVVLSRAEELDAWLANKASEPASSEYPSDSQGNSRASANEQAGAGSEQLPQETRPLPADDAGLVGAGDGEALASTPHIHDYQLRQGVRGFLVCACGKTTKRATA